MRSFSDPVDREFTVIEFCAGHPDYQSTWTFGLGLDGVWRGRNHYQDNWANVKDCLDKADYENLLRWFTRKGWTLYAKTLIDQELINGRPLPMHLRGSYVPLEVLQVMPKVLLRMIRDGEVLEVYSDQSGRALSITKPDGKRRVHHVMRRECDDNYLQEKLAAGWSQVPLN